MKINLDNSIIVSVKFNGGKLYSTERSTIGATAFIFETSSDLMAGIWLSVALPSNFNDYVGYIADGETHDEYKTNSSIKFLKIQFLIMKLTGTGFVRDSTYIIQTNLLITKHRNYRKR